MATRLRSLTVHVQGQGAACESQTNQLMDHTAMEEDVSIGLIEKEGRMKDLRVVGTSQAFESKCQPSHPHNLKQRAASPVLQAGSLSL